MPNKHDFNESQRPNSTHSPGAPGGDQEEVMRITGEYAEAYRAGGNPNPGEYVKRHPKYARELVDFFLYFHTIAADLPAPDAVPAAQLSPAAQAALAQIRAEQAQQAPQGTLKGLAVRGIELGILPPQLAAMVNLSEDMLEKLDEHAISIVRIPGKLIMRFADALKETPEAVASFLSGAQSQSVPGFFHADSAPQLKQDDFLDAIQASDLTPEQQQEWERIVEEEEHI